LKAYLKKKSSLFVIGIVLLGVLCLGSLCWVIDINPTFNLGKVYIKNLALSEAVDIENKQPINPTTRFPTTADQIVASFVLETDDKIPITVAWYENGGLATKQSFESESQWLAASINPRGEAFGVGQYKVQIWFGTLLLEEKEFEVFKAE